MGLPVVPSLATCWMCKTVVELPPPGGPAVWCPCGGSAWGILRPDDPGNVTVSFGPDVPVDLYGPCEAGDECEGAECE